MTNLVRRKNLKCIEWTVETFTECINYVSKEFWLLDCKCHLELSVGNCIDARTGYPILSLSFRSNEKLKLPVEIILAVYSQRIKLAKAISITTAVQNIWSCTGRGISNSLTFEVIIPHNHPEEDKCVQTASYLNAGVAVESIYEDFSRLLDSGPNHDAEIVCGEHSIKAHKVVLCSRSEVLSAMLQSNMLEGRTGIIEIKDMEISYVQEFLRYLYTGTMPELTFDKAKILYEAGDKYAVRSLMFRCSEYLQDSISSENVFQCFELGDKHSDQELKDKVISYILEKKTYLDEEIWMSFCKTYPETAIEVYRLSHKTQEMKDT